MPQEGVETSPWHAPHLGKVAPVRADLHPAFTPTGIGAEIIGRLDAQPDLDLAVAAVLARHGNAHAGPRDVLQRK